MTMEDTFEPSTTQERVCIVLFLSFQKNINTNTKKSMYKRNFSVYIFTF